MRTQTSEAVMPGHPDKLADQISDAILDAHLADDPTARVAVETMVTANGLILAGEVGATTTVDYRGVARDVLIRNGYEDYAETPVRLHITQQSPQIAAAVADGGAGDQGTMVGYATTETSELLPAPLVIARAIRNRMVLDRLEGPFIGTPMRVEAGADGKTQVTVRYDSAGKPREVTRVVASQLQLEGQEDLDKHRWRLEALTHIALQESGLEYDKARLHMQPAGAWTHGGPEADCGLTGRKIVADTYGTAVPHGGGAFSGKDPSKVDRTGAYAARWVAVNLVAAGAAQRAQIELAYAIGEPEPVAVAVDTFGTGVVPDHELEAAVQEVFDLRPTAISEDLNLRSIKYELLAALGHFGVGAPWDEPSRSKQLALAIR